MKYNFTKGDNYGYLKGLLEILMNSNGFDLYCKSGRRRIMNA